MASALTGMGRHQEASDTIDRALAIFDESEGADSLRLPVAWDTRGTTLLALGRYEEALAEFDKALEHVERIKHSDYVVARIQWGHGVALWETDPSSTARATAVEQARRARELLAGQPGNPAREIEQIETWLRSHPMPAGDIDER